MIAEMVIWEMMDSHDNMDTCPIGSMPLGPGAGGNNLPGPTYSDQPLSSAGGGRKSNIS